jgi:hypothetical protein
MPTNECWWIDDYQHSALSSDGDKDCMSVKLQSALVPPVMTTAQRDAILAGRRPPGSIIYNTTTNRVEQNLGTDATPNWVQVTPWLDTGWIAMTLENSWVNYGAPFAGAAYRRINGVVYLRGLVMNGTTGMITHLPAGYRPAIQLIAASSTNPNAWCRMDVQTDGGILATTYSASWVSLMIPPFTADA